MFCFWAKYEKLDWLEGVAFLFAWNQTKNTINGPVKPSSLQSIRLVLLLMQRDNSFYAFLSNTVPLCVF